MPKYHVTAAQTQAISITEKGLTYWWLLPHQFRIIVVSSGPREERIEFGQ
jgi:hypothetical protein